MLHHHFTGLSVAEYTNATTTGLLCMRTRDWDDDLCARLAGWPGVIYPDDPRLFNPPSMIGAINAQQAETGQSVAFDPVVVTKIVIDSLAFRYADVQAISAGRFPSLQNARNHVAAHVRTTAS